MDALWIPLLCSPLPLEQTVHMLAPMDRGKREQKGSTPGRSHPPQITICTRNLQTPLSRWRETHTQNGAERGKLVWLRTSPFAYLAAQELPTPTWDVSLIKHRLYYTVRQSSTSVWYLTATASS